MADRNDNSGAEAFGQLAMWLVGAAILVGILSVIGAFFTGLAAGAKEVAQTIMSGVSNVFYAIFKGVEWVFLLALLLIGAALMWYAGALAARTQQKSQVRHGARAGQQVKLSLEQTEPHNVTSVIAASHLPKDIKAKAISTLSSLDEAVAADLQSFKRLMVEAVADKHYPLPLADLVEEHRRAIETKFAEFTLPPEVAAYSPSTTKYVHKVVTDEDINLLTFEPSIREAMPPLLRAPTEPPVPLLEAPLETTRGTIMDKIRARLNDMKDLETMLRRAEGKPDPGIGPAVRAAGERAARDTLDTSILIEILSDRLSKPEGQSNTILLKNVLAALQPHELMQALTQSLGSTENDDQLATAVPAFINQLRKHVPTAANELEQLRRDQASKVVSDEAFKDLNERNSKVRHQIRQLKKQLEDQGETQEEINRQTAILEAHSQKLEDQAYQLDSSNHTASFQRNPSFSESPNEPMRTLPQNVGTTPSDTPEQSPFFNPHPDAQKTP